MTSGTHVRVDGVRKSYGEVAALAGLDLELAPGITGQRCRRSGAAARGVEEMGGSPDGRPGRTGQSRSG
jgi:anti-sigma-K factor RskA